MMKMRYVIIVVLLEILLCGCSKENIMIGNETCSINECMEMIDVQNSVSDINSIIGVDGELIDVGYNEYCWEVYDGALIYVKYNDLNVGEIKAEIDDELIINKDLNFKNINEIETLVNENLLDYQKLVNILGNVEGILIEKKTDELTYKWVGKDNKYLSATFSRDTGKCIMLTGMY